MSPRPHRATPKDAHRITTAASQLAAATADRDELHARLKRIERTLERVLSSPALSAAQREELLGLIAGTRTVPSLLWAPTFPAVEQQLIERYRALSGPRKRLLSLFLKELT